MMLIRILATLTVALAGATAFTYEKSPGPARAHAQQADQCKLPISERHGGWFCMTGGQQLPAAKGKCRFISPFGKGRAWCRQSDTLTGFRSTGFIGYGDGVLGSATVSFTVILKLTESHSL